MIDDSTSLLWHTEVGGLFYVYTLSKGERGLKGSSHALRLNSSLEKSFKQCASFLMKRFCFVNIEGLPFAAHPYSCSPVICS